jgi:hypothetical protein
MAAWWQHHNAYFPPSDEFRDNLEDLSGKNPLLLRSALEAAKQISLLSNAEDHESQIWEEIHHCPEWRDTKTLILQFCDIQWSNVERQDE